MENAQRERNAQDQKQGFTLIEVMVVILIGGLLMAGAFAGWQWLNRARAQDTDRKLVNLDAVIEMYYTKIGEYPQDLRELIEGPQKPALSKKFGEAMAKDSDLVDSWKQEFEYHPKPKGSRPPYELYSRGSKGDVKIYSPNSAE